jgi:hypothetical protein
MAKKKTVKIGNTPDNKKIPKSKGEPAQYKDLNVAWQTGMIDFDGDWGYWSYSDLLRFELTNDLIKELGDSLPDDIGNKLCELDNKSFNNIHNFINQLNSGISGTIEKHHLNLIFRNLKRYYFEEKIYPKLKEFENKNWYEIEQELFYGKGRNKTKHHSINISDLSKKAQKRLKQLQLNDIDALFSFRLEGELRIFGIRKFNYLQILWVDPKHEVCPVNR